MESPCPFWPDSRECSSKHCGIEHCDDEVPAALRRPTAVLSSVRYIQKLVHPGENRTGPCSGNDRRWSLLNKRANRTTLIIQIPNNQADSSEAAQKKEKCISSNQFDPLDRSLSEGDKAQLRDMDFFEGNEDKFCDMGGRLCFEFKKY